MSWAPKAGGANSAPGGAPTSVAVTLGAAVAVGDTINCALAMDTAAGSTGGQIIDSLGNSYVRKTTTLDSGNGERLETFLCVVTVAGTPTITAKFLPTPGTTTSSSPALVADPFSGSDASSASDGTGAGQVQGLPTTGTDLLTSGSFTTSTSGDLIYTATCDSATGSNPGAAGTGFTLLQTSSFVIVKTAYKVQSAAGSVAGTWTAAVSDQHITAAHAVTPAAGGAAKTPLDRAHSQQHQALIAA